MGLFYIIAIKEEYLRDRNGKEFNLTRRFICLFGIRIPLMPKFETKKDY
jgi:hypothetical protein